MQMGAAGWADPRPIHRALEVAHHEPRADIRRVFKVPAPKHELFPATGVFTGFSHWHLVQLQPASTCAALLQPKDEWNARGDVSAGFCIS